MSKLVVSYCLLLVLVALVGCGGPSRPDLIPVSGTINVDGVPAKNGRVNFYPAGGERSATARIINGKFKMSTFSTGDGVIPGSHKVTIKVVKTKETGAKPSPPSADASQVEIEEYVAKVDEWKKGQDKVDFFFPPELADRKTTTLEVLIDAEKNLEEFHWDSADFN